MISPVIPVSDPTNAEGFDGIQVEEIGIHRIPVRNAE